MAGLLALHLATAESGRDRVSSGWVELVENRLRMRRLYRIRCAVCCRGVQVMESSGRFWPSSISSGSGMGGTLNSRCLRCLRCLAGCGRRVVSVEPLVFLCVFSIFLQLTTFELYAFTRQGWSQLNRTRNGSRGSPEGCVTAKQLNEVGRRGNETADFVQGQVALLNLYVGVASQIPGIASAFILGPFSDRYGRKVALGIVLGGFLLQSVVAYIIIEFRLSLYLFVLGSGLRSLAGGHAGLLTVSRSFVTDISSRKWLTLRLGILVAVSFIASSLGLFVAGFWIGETDCDFTPVSWVIIVTSVLVMVYLLLFVRESLGHRQREDRSKLSLVAGTKSLLVPLKIFCDRSRGVPLWKLWFSLAVLAVTVLNQLGYLANVILFSLHQPLQWKPGLIGTYLAASEFIRGLSSIILLPILVSCSLSDPLIALVGVCIVCLTNVGTGFVQQSWQMFIGALFSVVSAVQVLSGALAFVLYSLAYKMSLERSWPVGSPFWLMALLYLSTIPFLAVLARYSKRSRRQLFVNFPTSPPPIPRSPTSPLPTTHHKHTPHPHHYHQARGYGASDDDGLGSSIQWALSRSQARRYQPPPILSPASVGRDTLERQGLLGRSRTSSYGSHSTSINS